MKAMKKIISVLLSFVLVTTALTALPFSVHAVEKDSVSVGATSGTTGDCTWTLTDDGVLTISGNGAIEDYQGFWSVPWRDSVKSANIENGVTSIGEHAFDDCAKLTSISIPNSVTNISGGAFYKCSSLKHIVLPNCLETIGRSAFEYSGLTSIAIPQSTISISDFAFWRCADLKNIILSENITSIASNSFGGCTSLTSITIPNNVTSIGESAFSGCTGLTSIVLSKNIKSIEDYSFCGCSSLTSITLPNGVTSIGASAFSECNVLNSVLIPDSVTEIGSWAFSNCKNLSSIDLPRNITTIGDNAFYDCFGITYVKIHDLSSWCNIVFTGYFSNPLYYGNLLYVNDTEISNLVIPNDVEKISDFAFIGYKSLTSVTIPECVTEIGDSAFENCSSDLKIYGYRGSYAQTYADENDISFIALDAEIDVSDCSITLSPTSYTYDGTEKQPSVTVKYGSTTLTKDSDYTISYSNNTNAGTATVTVTGKGGYTGSTTRAFTINAKSISSATVTLSPTSYTYDGTEKKPSVTVIDGSKTLTSGTDYSVSYSNNVNVGTATVTVTGKNNYTSSTSKTFTITEPAKIDISNCTITLSPTSYTYDGNAKQPSVTVKYGSTTLTKDTDYTVSYSNNTNAGTATVTITGKGGYTGSTTRTFTINAKSISSATVTLSPTSYTYDGTEKKPSVTVKDGTKTLTSGTDYSVSYSNNVNVGTATVTVTGKNNYTGSTSKTFTITEPAKIDISNCTITLSPTSYTYDGNAKQPSVTVKYGSTTLTKDSDYTVSYANNTNAGTATVTITGKGGYTGSTTRTFTINAKSISSATVTLSPTSYTYDGTEKKPSVTVKDGTKTLTSGTDYSVSYSNNVNVGTATVTVTGKNNYTGSTSKTFTITEPAKIDISNCTITLSPTSYTYDGNAKQPSVTVKYGSTTLTKDTDYTVSYSNNTNAGTATVTITGKGGYTGSTTRTFTINAKSISSATVTLSPTSYTYDGTEKKPSVTVKDGTKTLTNGTEYTVSYSNNTNVGTATVSVSGKGNYNGSTSKNFTISYESISLNSTKTINISTEGMVRYFQFTPTSDVNIRFYSTGDKDTYGYIYDSNLNLIDENDEGGEIHNFKIAYPLSAGTTYILACKLYDSDSTGNFEIYLEPYATETFVWGQDNWNFNNSSSYFGRYYYVDESIIPTFKSQFNIDNTDISNMNRKMNDKNASKGFTGSCYGMTVSEMLVKQGFLNLSDYGGDSIVNWNSNSNRMIISLINAIQLLQNTGDFSQTLRQTQFSRSSFSQDEFISRIEDVLQNNRMFLKIGYSIKSRVKSSSEYFTYGSHAVLAYGIESCSYYSNFTYKTYDRKILICDPNRSANNSVSDDACIYYRSSDHSWIIPYWYGDYYNSSVGNCTQMCYWNAGSTLDTKTGSIDNIIRYDAINESVDLMSEYGTDHYIAGLEMNSNNEAFVQEIVNSGNPNMEFAGEGGSGIVKFGTESDIDENGNDAFDSYALWNPTANYSVSFSSPSKINSLMDYEKVSYYLDSTNSTYVLYKPSGYIQMNGSESDYSVTMVTDDSECVTDWYEVTVSGRNADNVTYKKSNGGYILSATNLNNITITAENDSVTASRMFSTNYNSVFIYEIDENTIGLKVDTDGNGTYETELISDTLIMGDANGDGKLNIRDVTAIQRHVAEMAMLNEYQQDLADVNKDGEVTIDDATLIQRYLAEYNVTLG